MAFEIFGFKIERKSEDEQGQNVPSFSIPETDDGSVMVAASGAYGTYVDMEGQFQNEIDLIYKYREMALSPDCETAVDTIVNEAITIEGNDRPVSIVLDNTDLSVGIKKKIRAEFDHILHLMNFNNYGYEIFRRWYVEGRLYYHIMIDEKNPNRGIVELRSLDSTKIKKIRKVKQNKTLESSTEPKKLKTNVEEYFVYNESGLKNRSSNGVIISPDSIALATSGLLSSNKIQVLSYLHKAIKPLNQLRMVEDAIVIYRISRAPERRVFYIDVGNLPKLKAEQYIQSIMTRYKNRLVYDSNTGEVRDDRRHQSMLEDYWLPRREGGRGTEITTLPGGENLGNLEDIEYFQKKLFKALHVPISRLDSENGFTLGRESEITRDEMMFSKFIRKLQTRFSTIFDEMMERQLILRGIMTAKEWKEIKDKIHYQFSSDHFYSEIKSMEIMTGRVQLARDMEEYVGTYYSKEWFRTNVLMQSEEEIAMQDKQISKEKAKGELDDLEDEGDMGDSTENKLL